MGNIIGLVILIIGVIFFVITEYPAFSIMIFIGTILLASFSDREVFCDYIPVNDDALIAHKRHYKIFLPLQVIFSIFLPFRDIKLRMFRKEEYFKITNLSRDDRVATKTKRKEYKAIRKEQREFYSTQTLSKEFMSRSYTLKEIGFKRKRIRLIIAIVLAISAFAMIFEPEGIGLAAIYGAIFLPMIFFWIPEYRDAKILHNAYLRAMKNDSDTD